MRLLVTGAKGQLGCEVVKEGLARGWEVLGTDVEEMDLSNRDRVLSVVNGFRPDAAVHCAAWTAVDAAEDERERTYDVNVAGTETLARALGPSCKLIYLSTEYVFPGTGTRPWEPDDEVAPLNYYGETKAEGEKIVRALCKKHFIVRISWLFGPHGKNFVGTMLALGKKRDTVGVVCDQIGSPTYAPDLASLLLDMAQTERYGTYHASNEGVCSWYEFATEIFRRASAYRREYADVKVLPLTSEEYPARAKRPLNSRMNKQKLTDAGFSLLPDYRDALERYLAAIEV